MKKLQSLAENNAKAFSIQYELNSNKPIKNGIACPSCGNELLDSSPIVTLTSIPAQKNTHCDKCDYVGYRFT